MRSAVRRMVGGWVGETPWFDWQVVHFLIGVVVRLVALSWVVENSRCRVGSSRSCLLEAAVQG